jgi:hypothetical protein
VSIPATAAPGSWTVTIYPLEDSLSNTGGGFHDHPDKLTVTNTPPDAAASVPSAPTQVSAVGRDNLGDGHGVDPGRSHRLGQRQVNVLGRQWHFLQVRQSGARPGQEKFRPGPALPASARYVPGSFTMADHQAAAPTASAGVAGEPTGRSAVAPHRCSSQGGGFYRRPGKIVFRARRLGRCSQGGRLACTRLRFRAARRPGGPLVGPVRPWTGGNICRF